MTYKKEDIVSICNIKQIKYIRLQFTDLKGMLKIITIPSYRLNDILEGNITFDSSSVCLLTSENDTNLYLMPDINTFLILNYIEDINNKTARFICDIYKYNEQLNKKVPYSHCSRIILKNTLQKLKEEGIDKINIGFEMEFFIFKTKNNKPILELYDNNSYCDFLTDINYKKCINEILYQLKQHSFNIETFHHEASPSQYEINFKYSDALTSCDNVMTFKMIVKEIALKYKFYISFMPKPIYGINGSGMHLNVSLEDFEGINVFDNKNENNTPSSECDKFINGILTHAKGLTLITNPIVNSYKRLQKGYEAPCYISYSLYDRSSMIRIPNVGSNTRIEIRTPDGSSNPYLCSSVVLISGLDGIKGNCKEFKRKDIKKLKNSKVYELPHTLYEAILEFDKDKLIKECLGNMLSLKYKEYKLKEWYEYNNSISKYEIDKYFNKY